MNLQAPLAESPLGSTRRTGSSISGSRPTAPCTGRTRTISSALSSSESTRRGRPARPRGGTPRARGVAVPTGWEDWHPNPAWPTLAASGGLGCGLRATSSACARRGSVASGRRTPGTSSPTDDDELVLFAPIGAEAWFSGIPIPRRVDADTERVQGAPPPARAARGGLLDVADLGRELDASRVVRELRAAAASSIAGRLRLRRPRPRPRLLPGRTGGSCSTRMSSRRGWRAAC